MKLTFGSGCAIPKKKTFLFVAPKDGQLESEKITIVDSSGCNAEILILRNAIRQAAAGTTQSYCSYITHIF